MKFTVHDVGLGQFLTLEDGNGYLMVWDCGCSPENKPSEILPRLGYDRINRFFVTNFDQDHIEDLPNLRKVLRLGPFSRNRSISESQLRALKAQGGPITDAMESLFSMHRDFVHPLSEENKYVPHGITYEVFSNTYSEEISDTNNLSQVTILECNGKKIVITGDLERKGWDALLRETSISNRLVGTDVFIASHHGRENGYHETVMELASPECVVMSDYQVQHATQETLGLYRKHCRGVRLNGEPRNILTTRSDGTFSWTL